MRNRAARGEYHTPQEVADAVLENPPFDPSAPAPDAAETNPETNE